MIREMIQPNSEEYLLHIPKEYINKKNQIFVVPFVHATKDKSYKDNFKQLSKKTAGLLSKRNINPLKWQEEIRNEWVR